MPNSISDFLLIVFILVKSASISLGNETTVTVEPVTTVAVESVTTVTVDKNFVCGIRYPVSPFMEKFTAEFPCRDLENEACKPGKCIWDPETFQGVTCICPDSFTLYTAFNETEGLFVSQCTAVKKNPCDKCHERNTLACNVNHTVAKCVCSGDYKAESFCEDLIDPCKDLLDSSFNGDEACNVEKGNRCVPEIGKKFHCVCHHPYAENTALLYSNCQKVIDACFTVLCVFGKCNTNTTKCDCDHGYYGEHCESSYDVAEQVWSSWTSCYPSCANFGYMTSVRGCVSKVDKKFCTGMTKKWRRCLPKSCGFLLDSGDMTVKLKLTSEELQSIVLIAFFGGLTIAAVLICLVEAIAPGRKSTFVLGVK